MGDDPLGDDRIGFDVGDVDEPGLGGQAGHPDGESTKRVGGIPDRLGEVFAVFASEVGLQDPEVVPDVFQPAPGVGA